MQANNDIQMNKCHPLNLYGWAYAKASEHAIPVGQSGLSINAEAKLRHGLVMSALGVHVAALGIMFSGGASLSFIAVVILVALLPGVVVAVPATLQEGHVGLLKRHLCAVAIMGLYMVVVAKVLNVLVFSVFGPALMLMLENYVVA